MNENNAPLFGLAPLLDGNNWMSRFDGSTSLAQLTMPGTHDSGALFNLDANTGSQPLYQFAMNTVIPAVNKIDSVLHGVSGLFDNLSTIAYYTPFTGNLHYTLTDIQNDALEIAQSLPPLSELVTADLAQAQTLTLTEQLEAGVRFLDLRGRPANDTLEIFHGAIPQNQDFGEAFGEISAFLEAKPSETVVVYTQQESGNFLPIDFSSGDWLTNLVGAMPEALKPATNLIGANISSFFGADPDSLRAVRPDYLEDIRANYEGATSNGTFTSREAAQNFFNLLKNNYGINVAPVTQNTILGDYSSLLDVSTWVPNIPVIIAARSVKDSLNSITTDINSVVAQFGFSWLELQQTADASMEPGVQNGQTGSFLNGPYNSDLSYDELLNKYVQEVGADNFYLQDDVPTLDEARGKIVLMVREMGGESRDTDIPLGIDVTDKRDNGTGIIKNALGQPTVVTQDMYEPGTALNKWNAFIDLANAAEANVDNPDELMARNALYVNYLSATSEAAYTSFDIDRIGPVGYAFNAPVDIDGTTYQGLNAAFEDVFLDQRPDGRYGAMLIDFIDQDIARGIYEMNSVVGSAFMLNAALEPTVMRVDSVQDGLSSIQDVSFSLKRVDAESADIILRSSGPGALPHSLDMLGGDWLARESIALGDVANASQDLQAGVYIPVAILADGTELAILEVVAHDPTHLEVTFAAGEDGYVAPRAVFKLEGMDAVVVPADTQTATKVEVARLGQYTNGLAFYEAEQGTGAITVDGVTLLPGQEGYLQGALSLAKASGTLIRGDQMPEFGESATFDNIDLEAGITYGLLVLHQDNEADLSSSFSDANNGGHTQMVELPSVDGSIWYGIEDLHVAGGVSDRDFNDLLVNVQFT